MTLALIGLLTSIYSRAAVGTCKRKAAEDDTLILDIAISFALDLERQAPYAFR